jgi:flagellar protein FliS
MYHSSGLAGNASRRYAAVHAGSRVESASPHGLIKLLFEELLVAMDACALAFERGDQVKANDRHLRAISLIYALDSSLDFEKGGDIATGLAVIYREARRLMLLAAQQRSSAPVRQAHGIVAEIASAWNQIG